MCHKQLLISALISSSSLSYTVESKGHKVRSTEEEFHGASSDVYKALSAAVHSASTIAASNVHPLFPAVYIKEEVSDGTGDCLPAASAFCAPIFSASYKEEPFDCDKIKNKSLSLKLEPFDKSTEEVPAAEACCKPGLVTVTLPVVACKEEMKDPCPAPADDRHHMRDGTPAMDVSCTSCDSSSVVQQAAPRLASEAASSALDTLCQGSVSLTPLKCQEPCSAMAANSSPLVFDARSKCEELLQYTSESEDTYEAQEGRPMEALLTSRAKRFQCSHCKYSSSHKGTLMRHTLFKHSSAKPFQCSHCEYTSAVKSNIWRHTMTKHSIVEPFQCLQCEFSSDKINILKSHKKEKHFTDKPFQCSHCDFWSVNKTGLRRHIIGKHSGDRPYHCPHCKYSSAHKFHLKSHVLINHSDARPFQCGHCVRAFATNYLLKRHVLVKHFGPSAVLLV